MQSVEQKSIGFITSLMGVDMSDPNPDKNGDYFIHHLVKVGNVALFKRIMNGDGVNLNQKNSIYGFTPLMCACVLGKLDIVRLLCENPTVRVNELNDTRLNTAHFSSTTAALHLACAAGHLDIVKYLVEKAGADINLTTEMGRDTPLTYMINGNKNTSVPKLVEVLKYMVTRPGIDLSAKNFHQCTFLGAVVRKGSRELVTRICTEVLDRKVPHDLGMNALNAAISTDQMDMVRYFVEDVKVDLNDASAPPTPLYHAVCRDRCSMVTYFLEHGADPNLYSHEGDEIPPLIRAIMRRCNNVAIRLLEGGADPNIEKPNDWSTPFHMACRVSNFKMIDYLMGQTDAKIDHLDVEGRSVIYYLVQKSDHLERRKELIRDLIARGVRVVLPAPDRIDPMVRDMEFLQ